MTARLLVVEDDPRIAGFLRRGLVAEGYSVETAADGRDALAQVRSEKFDVIILDRMLPGADGLEVCKQLRQAGDRTLVLMLTAKDSLQDKIEGLKGGADDYLVKPFAFDELLARIGALLRRPPTPTASHLLQVADLQLDTAAKAVRRGEREISLTAREFALLECLMKNAGVVLSREDLLSRVWHLSFEPGTNVVEVYIRYLRRKIDDGEAMPLIKTVRGFGYSISA
jgi:two-component system OmpR family response regulator